MLLIDKFEYNIYDKLRCENFIKSSDRPKFIFGNNIYSRDIINNIKIDGFIDDFTKETTYFNKPIFRLEDVPKDSYILILATGKPFTAMNRVKSFGLEYIDYFTLLRYSMIPLRDVSFNEGFLKDYIENSKEYDNIYDQLNDDLSQQYFKKLINFRLSYDIKYLDGLKSLEDVQYFEDFIRIDADGVFVDVGGYDGYTSEQFIKKYPEYNSIYFFEPDDKNMVLAKSRLSQYKNIYFYQNGLSSKKQVLNFNTNGSSSTISDCGDYKISVDRLDNIIDSPVSFLKMDIEGAEMDALEGAQNIIKKYRPQLAISVYHNAGDFWKIPAKIKNIHNDYSLYFRHYTESIYESVMFFV